MSGPFEFEFVSFSPTRIESKSIGQVNFVFGLGYVGLGWGPESGRLVWNICSVQYQIV